MDFRNSIGKVSKLLNKYKYVLLIILIGLALMLIPGSNSPDSIPEPIIDSNNDTLQDTEQRLTEILSSVAGAGKVQVLLTTVHDRQIIYQTDREESGDRIQTETVLISGSDRGQEGLIKQVNAPTYRGAIIVCQGADDPVVKLSITEAVSRATGLGADKISVIKMK
jgi:stage III sporulation protein AG